MIGSFAEALRIVKAVFPGLSNAFTEYVQHSKRTMFKLPRTIVDSDTTESDDACGLARPTKFTLKANTLTSRSSLPFSFNFAVSPDTFFEFCVACLCLAMLVFLHENLLPRRRQAQKTCVILGLDQRTPHNTTKSRVHSVTIPGKPTYETSHWPETRKPLGAFRWR